MENVTVYLNEARSGFVVCQRCGTSKQIEFTEGRHRRSGVAKCACSNTFRMIFENRQYYRKQVDSYGEYFSAGRAGGEVKLVDISRSGVGFIKMGGTPLQVNEKIKVSFSLGNDAVSCVASVANIRDDRVGAKFVTPLDAHSNKVLGFFLLP